jgi:hypothetical protein
MFSLQFFMQKISFRQSVLREYPNFIFAPLDMRGVLLIFNQSKKKPKKKFEAQLRQDIVSFFRFFRQGRAQHDIWYIII